MKYPQYQPSHGQIILGILLIITHKINRLKFFTCLLYDPIVSFQVNLIVNVHMAYALIILEG